MPFKCCVASCKSNYDSTDATVTTFEFPEELKEPDLRARWVKFVSSLHMKMAELLNIYIEKFDILLFAKHNGWGVLSFNSDNTDIYFDLTSPLKI